MAIRDAVNEDIPAITEIYNDAVFFTTAIWNDTPVDENDRLAWLSQRQQAGLPVLVATAANGDVLGYASYGPWRAWDGYRHTVEHSVYVGRENRRGGVGLRLMEALVRRAREEELHVMVAGIEAANLASVRLHEKLGFTQSGCLKQVGTKFGEWLDLLFMQLILTPDAPVPGWKAQMKSESA